MVVAPLAAGAGAGIAASIVRVPTEVVKQRMQMGEFKTAVSAVSRKLSCCTSRCALFFNVAPINYVLLVLMLQSLSYIPQSY